MKGDLLKWGALAAALVVTMSGEYELAVAVGFNRWVAAGVPAALDIYAVRALRTHRDVLAVVVAMIAVNSLSHLVAARLLPVSVPLVVAVSAIAPMVLWRVHSLGEKSQPAVEGSADVLYPERRAAGYGVPEAVQHVPVGPVQLPEPAPLETARPVPVLAAEGPRTRPEVRAEYVPEEPEGAGTDGEDAAAIRSARHAFRDLLALGQVPSIRGIRTECAVGQDRAKRVQAALRQEVQA